MLGRTSELAPTEISLVGSRALIKHPPRRPTAVDSTAYWELCSEIFTT